MKPYNNHRFITSCKKLRRKPLVTIHSYNDSSGVKKRPAMSINPHHKMRRITNIGHYH